MTLKSWSMHQEVNRKADKRLLRQSYLVLLLLIVTGCRISEVTGLRHRDIYQLFKGLYLRIRPNYERGAKTTAAKRIMEIGRVLSDEEKQLLLNWLKAERRRMGKRWKMTLPLFIDAETNRPVDRDLLRRYTQLALRQSTGWRLISHHIRHALGGRIQLDVGLLQQTVIMGVRMDWPLDYVLGEKRTLLLPRQTKRNQILIGHASDVTTNRSYGHTPWVYLHYRALEWQEGFDTRKAAIAVGVSAVNYRKMTSRHGQRVWEELINRYLKPREDSPLDKTWEIRNVPAVPAAGMMPEAQYIRALAPAVTNPKKGIGEQDYLVFGLEKSNVEALLKSAEDVARATGIAFFPRHSKLGRSRASMVPQTTPYSERVFGLLDVLETEFETAQFVTTAYISAANRNKRDLVLLPRRQSEDLRGLVAKHCQGLELKIKETTKGYRCCLADPDNNNLDHWLAWILALLAVLADATMQPESRFQ